MILVLAALIAADPPAGQVLECTVPDRHGRPMGWSVKLDQPMGFVEVTVGKSAVAYKSTAIYRPDVVKFELFDASVSIDRVSGTIRRTLREFGNRNVVEGTCVTVGGLGKKT